jgi:predicted nucleic acid-binding protein
MNAEVVDASALAALLFGEPGAERVAEWLEGASLFAPSLIRYELASVWRKKLRRYPTRGESLLAALDLYLRLSVAEAEVPVVELALFSERAKVTAYDAAYLWVARHTGAPLLTLNAELASAAGRLGVALVS